jgi:hypothetical protein
MVALGQEGKRLLSFERHRDRHTAQITDKLDSEPGKAAYLRRKWIAEAPNGWIKNVVGFRSFSMRGLERIHVVWKLVCMALNLRRMCSLSAASRTKGQKNHPCSTKTQPFNARQAVQQVPRLLRPTPRLLIA